MIEGDRTRNVNALFMLFQQTPIYKYIWLRSVAWSAVHAHKVFGANLIRTTLVAGESHDILCVCGGGGMGAPCDIPNNWTDVPWRPPLPSAVLWPSLSTVLRQSTDSQHWNHQSTLTSVFVTHSLTSNVFRLSQTYDVMSTDRHVLHLSGIHRVGQLPHRGHRGRRDICNGDTDKIEGSAETGRGCRTRRNVISQKADGL